MKRHVPSWWLMPSLLSLDAPVVAVAWQHLIATALNVRLDLVTRVALALAVWSIYL